MIIRYKNICVKCGYIEYSEEKIHTCGECAGKVVSEHVSDILDEDSFIIDNISADE